MLDDDLRKAALLALRIDRRLCRAYSEQFSWQAATRQFIAQQQPLLHPPAMVPAPCESESERIVRATRRG